MTDPADIKIPGYTILSELGRGGMATVYMAMQESIDRKVALKVMLPALLADPSFSQRFLREAKIVAQLSHPHIVAVFDVGISDQHHYIAMEYHEGGELKDRIKKGLTLTEIFSITKQMASALDFAHSKGYVHRDIKPENVLFKYDGSIVLSDFGIARGNDGSSRMTATGSVIGTPHYMSPEQAQGQELDGRSDLYSLGIVFFEMLVGVLPYRGDSALSIGIKHMRDPIPKLPGQYKALQGFLDKLIAKEPEDRWQSGADVVRQLETLELQLGDQGGVVTSQNAAIGATAVNNAISGSQEAVAQTVQTAAAPAVKSGGGALKWIMTSIIVAAIAGGGYYYVQTQPGGLAGLLATGQKPETASKQTDSITKSERLLAQAKAAMKKKRYFSPKRSSALGKYQQLLKLEPDNEQANQGLYDLADILIVRAAKSIKSNKLKLAEQQLTQAEKIAPEHEQLADSRQALDDARAKSNKAKAEQQRLAGQKKKRAAEDNARNKELASLLSKADELLSPYRLTPSRIRQARKTFRKAGKISPRDRRVVEGDRRVADAYLRLASDLSDRKSFTDAKALVNEGLRIVPRHAQLNDLKAYIDRQSAAPAKPTKRRTFGGF